MSLWLQVLQGLLSGSLWFVAFSAALLPLVRVLQSFLFVLGAGGDQNEPHSL